MNVTRTIRLTAATLLTLALFTATNASARTVRCVVPKLSGVTLRVARHRLEHAHCRAGMIHRPKTASGGLIVRGQRPKAGRKVRRGSKVTLWLRAKPSKVTLTAPAPTPTVTTPTSTPPAAPIVRAAVDPSFTQDPADNLKVTWSYSASATNGTLPDGVLSITIAPNTGSLASVGGCSMNVGGTVTGGACTITLPAYGEYNVTVEYVDSDGTVAPAISTETEDIQALPVPPSAPVIVTYAAVLSGSTQISSCGPCGAAFYVPRGGVLVVDAEAGDGTPQGAVDFTLSPTTGYTESGGPTGSNWLVGSDCAAIPTSGVASDGCQMTFTGDGTYSLALSYVSSDPNYLSTTGPTLTVVVTG